jgi:membrane fusion protein (multidrug efflux system)
MEMIARLAFGVVLGVLIVCDSIANSPTRALASRRDAPVRVDRSVTDVTGRVECAPGRKGTIAPVPLHPVLEVLVAPGDRVTKGQALVKLDDDEARADVRGKEAGLESARIARAESHRYLEAVQKTYRVGSSPEQRYHEVRVAALKAEMDERAAEAELESARAELEHYVVTAAIDGVVSRLDVNPGTVARPGTTVWGEILDLSEIDVRCELPPDRADRVSLGQAVEVRRGEDKVASGRVVFVGITVVEGSFLVPVVVRVPNRNGRLRYGMPVQVRFNDGLKVMEAK